MAYIRKVKNREGKYYVYLVEGYREKGKVKQRTLKNFGSLEELEKQEPGAFERSIEITRLPADIRSQK